MFLSTAGLGHMHSPSSQTLLKSAPQHSFLRKWTTGLFVSSVSTTSVYHYCVTKELSKSSLFIPLCVMLCVEKRQPSYNSYPSIIHLFIPTYLLNSTEQIQQTELTSH